MSERRFVVIALVVVIAVVGAFIVLRGGGDGPSVQWDVPDPATPAMLEPVRRAIGDARQRVVANPGSAETWGNYGAVCDAHHLYEPALLCYDRARRLSSDDFRWPYLLAIVSDFVGRDGDEVVALFEEAREMQPSFPPLHVRLGDALVRMGRIDEARDAYRRAVELDANFAMAHRGLGQALLALSRASAPNDTDTIRTRLEAIHHLERAAELDATDAVVQGSLAQAYRSHGETGRAETAAQRAAERSPTLGLPDPVRYAIEQKAMTPDACRARALKNMAEGKIAEALRDLLIVEEMLPEDGTNQLRIAVCHLSTGDRTTAKTHLLKAVGLKDDLIDAHRRLAEVYEAEQNLDAAIRHYRRALAHVPNDASITGRLALIMCMSGDLDGGIEMFEHAATLAPADAELHTNWGTALLRRGDPREAANHFRAALTTEPNNPDILFNLGQCLEQQGRTGGAMEQYRRAARVNPNHQAAQRLKELGGR
ncbi:MAG: tetratricopeptide repeat protein [Planctomycetota bacterium]|jgi:tetratricopeptide (TPR) repeat protein